MVIYYLILLIELLVVGWVDIRTKKIANHWTIGNLLLAVVLLFLGHLGPTFSLQYLFFPAIFFGVGFVLYLIKVMGAGDVKFITSFFLLQPITIQKIFIDGLLYATVLVGIVLILINTVKHFKFILSCIVTRTFNGLGSIGGKKFSYAPVILLAWLYTGWHLFQRN